MHDPRIYTEYAGLQPMYWLKCPGCGTRVGPYLDYKTAESKARRPITCHNCGFKKHYSASVTEA